jgi:hypothetical protein
MFCLLYELSEYAKPKQDSGLFNRQAQRKDRTSGTTGAIDGAVVMLDEILGNGQP